MSNIVFGQDSSIEQTEADLKSIFGLDKLKALNRLTQYYQKDNPRKALRYGRQALTIGENIFNSANTSVSLKERHHLVQAYFQLGEILFEKGNYFSSQENFEAAKDLSKKIKNHTYQVEITKYLDKLQLMVETGEIKENFFSKNFGNLKVGETINEASKDVKIQSEITIGKTVEKKGDFKSAIGHYEKAINLLKDKGDVQKINELQLKIAFLLDSLDQHKEAQQFLGNVISDIEQEMENISVEFLNDSLNLIPKIKQLPPEEIQELRSEQKSLREISENLAKEKNFEKSLAYYKLYQELSQKMVADSLALLSENMQRENKILLLKQQKEIADLNVEALKKEKEKQIRLRDTFILITLLILGSTLITFYFYTIKKREHKKLEIAYRDLDKTKNKLVGAEKKIVKLLSQQVSGDVAKELLMNNANKPGERRFVCIMFLDIRDFTPMAEKLTPEEIINYQNNVFGFMIDVVQKHDGNINQLLGDGFMATFGAPVSKGNDCQNAFLAAKEILQEVKERSEAGVIPKTKIGIGLHAGYVVTGNVGNEARKQYSVTGNPVIIASRVEQLNKAYKSQLIITEEVYLRLDQPVKLPQPFLEVEVKGRTNPVKILKIA